MAILGIDDFKSKLTGGGARPSLFKATVNFPSYVSSANVELTSFLCKQATIPASTIGGFELGFRGRKVKIAGDRTFENLTLTVINDAEFDVRNAFEEWMNGISRLTNGSGEVNPQDYTADANVDQLGRNGEIHRRYNFVGLFPTNISEIPLSFDCLL